MTPAERLEAAIRHPRRPGRPAVMPYLVSGFPSHDAWSSALARVSQIADAIEVGVPFSDPMADGPVIQRASRVALDGGVTLRKILRSVRDLAPGCPLVLMSYTNPLMQLGFERAVDEAAEAGFSGFIVPDLPWEEGDALRTLLEARGMCAVQLVTPMTPDDRVATLGAGVGFTYAVTINGITGAEIDLGARTGYLDRVRRLSARPVCAGFGIRSAADIDALTGHADGAIVGSALVDAMARGEDAEVFVRRLLGDADG
jgi:tryptophan synthase alpha chain